MGKRVRAAILAFAAWAVCASPPTARAEDLDMKRIFRCTAPDAPGQAECDRARDLVTFNCTACHLFVRIVLKQADPPEWDGVLVRHRERVARLSDDQFRSIRNYLVANFRPDLVPPELPADLLALY